MTLRTVEIGESWLELQECDICGQRFSKAVIYNWPLCAKGEPHEYMSSDEQKKSQGGANP